MGREASQPRSAKRRPHEFDWEVTTEPVEPYEPAPTEVIARLLEQLADSFWVRAATERNAAQAAWRSSRDIPTHWPMPRLYPGHSKVVAGSVVYA